MIAAASTLGDSSGRFVPTLIAVLVYLAIIALAAMLLVGNFAERWREQRDGLLTVQLAAPADEGERIRAAEKALTRIRGLAEVARAQPLPENRRAGLFEHREGPARGVPAPTVLEVELRPQAGARADSVRSLLQTEFPDAQIDRGDAVLNPALRLMRAIEVAAFMLVIVLGATLAAVVVFATQARLAAGRETIEILHLLGAEDAGIIEAVVSRALRTLAAGALLGLALGVTTLLIFVAAAMPGSDRIFGYFLSPAAWIALALPPSAAAAIAVITARLTVRRALATMP